MSWLPDGAVLECANCSLHATVDGALSKTVVMASLSIVPKTVPAVVSFASREANAPGKAGGVVDWTDVGSNDVAFR